MKKSLVSSTYALCLAGVMLLAPGGARAEAASDIIKQRQEKVLNVVNNSGKAVVGIAGIGSGVVVSKDGLIMTAGHVLDPIRHFKGEPGRPEGEFDVRLSDGREVKAKVLGANMSRDSALARIITPGEYAFAEMADPSTIKQGDWCVAMGHPGGFQFDRAAPVRVGRLWKKEDKAYYRSDCTVSGGDSGGPLFNLDGKLIGIHSSIGERLEENRHVPVAAFKESWDRMEKGDVWGSLGKLMPELKPFERKEEQPKPKSNGSAPKPQDTPAPPKTERAFLGVQMDALPEGGVGVSGVRQDSPADKAGIKSGDQILKIDGKDVNSPTELAAGMLQRKPGDVVKLMVKTGNSTREVEVKLGKL
jgi:serine protease Do